MFEAIGQMVVYAGIAMAITVVIGVLGVIILALFHPGGD